MPAGLGIWLQDRVARLLAAGTGGRMSEVEVTRHHSSDPRPPSNGKAIRRPNEAWHRPGKRLRLSIVRSPPRCFLWGNRTPK